MKSCSGRIFTGLLVSLFVMLAFIAGFFLRKSYEPRQPELALVREAVDVIRSYALQPPADEVAFERAMIHAAVGTLGDPYSVYVEPPQHELQRDDLSGEYFGIGSLLSIDAEGRVILAPYPDGPAYRAGIRTGDALLSVDGENVLPFPDIEALIATLRGPEKSVVELTVQPVSPGAAAASYAIVRQRFEIPSVTAFPSPLNSEIGVIKIMRFAESSPAEVEAGYRSLLEGGMRALVLDLRDNGGGLLDSTVHIARDFLREGLVLTEERVGGEIVEYRVERPGEFVDLPMVVLVNGNTASASEVLAAALSENQRAPLVGTTTFGKGTVQAVVELSDGSSLHITTARWLTPNGETLDETGLNPAYEISEPGLADAPDPYLALAQIVLMYQSVQ